MVRLAVAGRGYSHSETGAATTLFRSFLRRVHGSGAAGRRKFLAPMLRDVGAGAEPDFVETAHIGEELDQALATAGPADQPVMQADRQELRRAALALAIEHVEGVAHVSEKIIAGGKAGVVVEAVVVDFVRLGKDELGPAGA